MTSSEATSRGTSAASRTGAKRLILGTVVSNGGDAAILHAQLRLLDQALGPAETIIEDNDPVLAHELFPELAPVYPGRIAAGATRATKVLRNVHRPGLRRVAAKLSGEWLPAVARHRSNGAVDAALESGPVVFYTGGTSLIEKYDLDAKFRHLLRTLEMRRPLILLPQSVGPFQQARNAEAMRIVVAGATLVLLRDERSFRHLEEIGCDMSAVRVVPDVVFCLAGPDDVNRLAHADIPAHRPNVALGIRDCRKFFSGPSPEAQQAALVTEYAELAARLVRTRQARVRLVSTCQGIARYWTDDSEISRQVYSLLPEDVAAYCELDRGFHDTEGLRSVLRQQDLVVANRLHGAILSLTAGVPVVPVEYEFKTREVFRQLKQEGAVYSIEQAGTDSLADHVDGFVATWSSERADAAAALAEMVDGAWSAATEIATVVH